MARLVIYVGNDNIIEFGSGALLTDEITGDTIPDATVEVTLKDADGVDIVGETWPLSMPAVEGESGNYRATLADELVLTVGQKVTAEVTADDGPGARAAWTLTTTALLRT